MVINFILLFQWDFIRILCVSRSRRLLLDPGGFYFLYTVGPLDWIQRKHNKQQRQCEGCSKIMCSFTSFPISSAEGDQKAPLRICREMLIRMLSNRAAFSLGRGMSYSVRWRTGWAVQFHGMWSLNVFDITSPGGDRDLLLVIPDIFVVKALVNLEDLSEGVKLK